MLQAFAKREPAFDVAAFIRESNLIDRQYDLADRLIPGDRPGTPMFDNHMRAFSLFAELIAERPTPPDLVLRLHRELTRGIDAFESRNQSGRYRNVGVHLEIPAGPPTEILETLSVDYDGPILPARVQVPMKIEHCPDPKAAKAIVERILIPAIEDTRTTGLHGDAARRFAWWCHDLFECAHPFIDGNGRTGRLLLNLVLEMFGQEKLVVWNRDKLRYYNKIQHFREEEFDNLVAAKLGHPLSCNVK